jgi:hypothetical protein
LNEKSANALNNFGLLTLINAYDLCGDKRFLELAEYLMSKIECYLSRDYHLINILQVKKRKEGLDDEDVNQLNSVKDTDKVLSFGKYTLLGDKSKAKAFFDLLTKEERDFYKTYPIYYLYNNL